MASLAKLSTFRLFESHTDHMLSDFLQVAAYTSGRSSVSPHDCTLLQHVLWQRPEESDRIADHILKQLATDERRLEQIDYLFKGIALLLMTEGFDNSQQWS